MREDPERPTDAARHLRMMPVLTVADPASVDTVRAGALRAGDGAAVSILPEPDGSALLAARRAGADVVVCVCDGAAAVRVLNTARRLGGRAVPVLGLGDAEGAPRVLDASLSLLGDPALMDANVPVPAVTDDANRRALWDQLRAAHVEERHQLVETQGEPALAELETLGLAPPRDRWAALAAGAAGVLAGRMAAANRAWRGQVEA